MPRQENSSLYQNQVVSKTPGKVHKKHHKKQKPLVELKTTTQHRDEAISQAINPEWSIDGQNTNIGLYEFVQVVGKGKFSIVFKGRIRKSNELCALKKLRTFDLMDQKKRTKVRGLHQVLSCIPCNFIAVDASCFTS